MPRISDKRDKLIEAAKALIHRQGFYRTTLADIAKESKVPLGNVYYYFKTKEDICEEVINERKRDLRNMMDACCNNCNPRESLKKILSVFSDASESVAKSGCPVGSLCQELSKSSSALTESAEGCLHTMIDWSTKRFDEMGLQDTKQLAFDFVARLQGTMLLGNALHDPEHVKSQLRNISNWIDSLGQPITDVKQ